MMYLGGINLKTEDSLLSASGMVEAKKRGVLRSEGKTYVVKDGDVINVLFTQTKSQAPA